MAGERIFRFVGAVLEELAVRNPARRYKLTTHPTNPPELIYLQFTDAEEAARDAEEALPPPPFGGLGGVLIQHGPAGRPDGIQTVINWTAPIDQPRGVYWAAGQPSRVTVPANQAGAYEIRLQNRFAQAVGGGLRAVEIRKNGAELIREARVAVVNDRTQWTICEIEDLAGGDFLELVPFQNSGVSVSYGARLRLRRLE
jgi:hypothetical protein